MFYIIPFFSYRTAGVIRAVPDSIKRIRDRIPGQQNSINSNSFQSDKKIEIFKSSLVGGVDKIPIGERKNSEEIRQKRIDNELRVKSLRGGNRLTVDDVDSSMHNSRKSKYLSENLSENNSNNIFSENNSENDLDILSENLSDNLFDSPPWGLDRINQKNLPLDKKYDPDYSGKNVDVYIIDTGIDTTHSAFSHLPGEYVRTVKNIFDAYSEHYEVGVNIDGEGHGTHVAGKYYFFIFCSLLFIYFLFIFAFSIPYYSCHYFSTFLFTSPFIYLCPLFHFTLTLYLSHTLSHTLSLSPSLTHTHTTTLSHPHSLPHIFFLYN